MEKSRRRCGAITVRRARFVRIYGTFITQNVVEKANNAIVLDFGPKHATPLICLPGIAGSAAVFFKLIAELSAKGHRVISVRGFNHSI